MRVACHFTSTRVRAALALQLVLAAASLTRAGEDWPEFRGPTGQGLSSAVNLPTDWNPNKNVRWKTDIDGRGWSSPVVHQGRIFLTTAVSREDDKQANSLRAVCLSAENGEIIWNVEVFEQPAGDRTSIHAKNSHASPTPIVDGEYLYVHFGTHGTACLTLDGSIVWKTQKLVYAPQHGNGGSPVLVDDVLVVSCDGADKQFVAALDKSNGEIRWQTPRPSSERLKKFSFSTPLVIEVNGQKQIVSSGGHAVAAYAPATGDEIWHVKYDGYSVVPRPVYGNGLVFISTSFDNATVLAIHPDGHGDVTDTHVAWKTSKGAPNTPSLLLVGDELYMVSDQGVVTCLNAEDGKQRWKQRLSGNFSASPLYADGRIYIQSEQGMGTVFEAGTKYKRIAQNDMEAPTLASPAVVDSALLIRTESALYRIEKGDAE